MNSVSQAVPRGLRAQYNVAVIPQCCSWVTQLQCGKGLSTLVKAFPHQHSVPPPAFHLSSEWHGVRRGKGKDDMKRMWLQYLTQRPQHASNVPNALFLSELYKQVTASKRIFKSTVHLITSNQWVTSVPGNCIKQKRHRYLKVINWDSRFIDLIVLSPVTCILVSGINHQCKIMPEIFTIPSTAMVNMKNVIRYSNSWLSQF